MTAIDRVVLRIPGDGVAVDRLRRAARERGFSRFARRRGDRLRLDGRTEAIPTRVVGTPEELRAALHAARSDRPVLIHWTGDRVIPLEQAIASRPAGVELWVEAGSARELPAALGALERGADAVVVTVRSERELHALERYLPAVAIPSLDWRLVRIERVEPVGTADRILVDTLHFLPPGAGLLVGSAADFLLLVASEATGSPFSGPRAFRVNAGAPHSYVLRPDGATRYLAELGPGESLLLAEPGRPPGAVRVGRVKIERRPMVLVAVRVGSRTRTLFLQEAETVRLVGPRGPRPLTELATGDRVRGVALPAARHLGAVVDETIEER